MKKTLGYLMKVIVAGLISVIVLSLFSMIYYHPPIATQQPDGSTNFKYIPDSMWTFMLEGIGYGKTDNLGYNNAYYNNCSNPDIVFVGSSHMEGLQVPQEANCVCVLNELFDTDTLDDNDYQCLNLGISGHFFEVTMSNYTNIAKKFNGAKYIVIEVPEVQYSTSVLDEMLQEKFRAPLEKKGFVYEAAQRVPFLRLLYKKMNEAASDNQAIVASDAVVPVDENAELEAYVEKMNAVLGKISSISAENDIEPIILLHERFWEDKDGNIVMGLNEKYKNAFLQCCEANGLEVIDASPAMVEAYENQFEFSYGFSNTVPGEGHLNETGHRIIAETVYNYINETEGHR